MSRFTLLFLALTCPLCPLLCSALSGAASPCHAQLCPAMPFAALSRHVKHSSELEPQALKLPLGISLARSVMGLIKSRAEAGANANIMQ